MQDGYKQQSETCTELVPGFDGQTPRDGCLAEGAMRISHEPERPRQVHSRGHPRFLTVKQRQVPMRLRIISIGALDKFVACRPEAACKEQRTPHGSECNCERGAFC